MPQIQVVFLWHQHQPFYKDLASGEYRLPWVRMHALKDYYGMVRLLDEFPNVHQTFNLVPSLIAQIQEYVSGTARDPFFEVAAKPARLLSLEERRFALTYLFQANERQLIGRYPRYRELWDQFRGMHFSADRAAKLFSVQDMADLQVLSQLSWFDEFFLDQPDLAEVVSKGRNYTEDEQRLVIDKEREIMAAVLPAHKDAASARPGHGCIELSTSPYYHPIMPLVCDSNMGAVSQPGLPLPQARFCHPEDAREQLRRGLDLHERVFGIRPRGVWPSEGSVSEEVLGIAHELGVEWMATDEGVLGRTLGAHFDRDHSGTLKPECARTLYKIYEYKRRNTAVHLIFRDHSISDLIGFVYSGVPAGDAAADFIARIRRNAEPVIRSGRDAVVPIILDGENAWEFYPKSGREFLRRLYAEIDAAPDIEALTVSEAIERQKLAAKRVATRAPKKPDAPSATEPVIGRLTTLVPGSWINANFNVWIGAPEDNRAWDYLAAAREFYAHNAKNVSEPQRELAFEELLIAEGSDWNWWYGPEHHSANDRDFDELYRKHLSNIYQALGATPPDNLAHPISAAIAKPTFSPQTAYIHPNLSADYARYFDWIGAAMYSAERRTGAMHGAQFLLECIHAGVDESNFYGRVDFVDDAIPEGSFEVVVNLEATPPGAQEKHLLRLEAAIVDGVITEWKMRQPADDDDYGSGKREKSIAGSHDRRSREIEMRLQRGFEFKVPLSVLSATLGSEIKLRFSIWRNRLPVDALPVEGWVHIHVASREELEANVYNYSVGN